MEISILYSGFDALTNLFQRRGEPGDGFALIVILMVLGFIALIGFITVDDGATKRTQQQADTKLEETLTNIEMFVDIVGRYPTKHPLKRPLVQSVVDENMRKFAQEANSLEPLAIAHFETARDVIRKCEYEAKDTPALYLG